MIRSMTDGSMPYDEYFFFLDMDQATLVDPQVEFTFETAKSDLANHY